jgi:isoleucyl-tRNA synthetase
MDEYRVHEAVRKIKQFLLEDLSHTYVRFIRRRTWTEKQTHDKLAAYATLYLALKSALVMMSPLVPFFTESIYQHMFRNAELGNPQTVHLLDWPRYDDKWIDEELEAQMKEVQAIVSSVAVARNERNLKQRQPVPQIVVASDSKTTRQALKTFGSLMLDQTNTRILTNATKRSAARYESELNIKRYAKANFATGNVYVDLKLTKKDMAEGLARDVVRRMQQMRKEMDLKVDSYVHAYITAPSREVAKLLLAKRGYISREVRAKKLAISTETTNLTSQYYSKTWQIEEKPYRFGLCESSKFKSKVGFEQAKMH